MNENTQLRLSIHVLGGVLAPCNTQIKQKSEDKWTELSIDFDFTNGSVGSYMKLLLESVTVRSQIVGFAASLKLDAFGSAKRSPLEETINVMQSNSHQVAVVYRRELIDRTLSWSMQLPSDNDGSLDDDAIRVRFSNPIRLVLDQVRILDLLGKVTQAWADEDVSPDLLRLSAGMTDWQNKQFSEVQEIVVESIQRIVFDN